MLSFVTFRALGKINVFKNCSLGICGQRFSKHFLKVFGFLGSFSYKNISYKKSYWKNVDWWHFSFYQDWRNQYLILKDFSIPYEIIRIKTTSQNNTLQNRKKTPVLEFLLNKFLVLKPATLLNIDSNTIVFQWILQNFSVNIVKNSFFIEHLSWLFLKQVGSHQMIMAGKYKYFCFTNCYFSGNNFWTFKIVLWHQNVIS